MPLGFNTRNSGPNLDGLVRLYRQLFSYRACPSIPMHRSQSVKGRQYGLAGEAAAASGGSSSQLRP